MTTSAGATPPPGSDPEVVPSFAERLAFSQRAGGVIVPIFTALFAFFVGGLVVFATTGKNPLSTYEAIFNGTGLNWFFPWVDGPQRTLAALNLQQTLLIVTPLMLTGVAVACAFRCGLFNIGGNGQYIVGSIVAVQVGVSLADLPQPLHIIPALAAATVAGAAWGGIAGILKATV